MMIASPDRSYLSCGVFVCEGNATAGIDVMTSVSAPAGECLWIDHSAVGDMALGVQVVLQLVDALVPIIVADGEDCSIRHDAQNRLVIGRVVPGDADSTDLLSSTVASSG